MNKIEELKKEIIWKGTLGEARKHPLYKLGKEEAQSHFLKKIDDFGEILINRICRPNKEVNTFWNAREHEEIIKEELEELKKELEGKR